MKNPGFIQNYLHFLEQNQFDANEIQTELEKTFVLYSRTKVSHFNFSSAFTEALLKSKPKIALLTPRPKPNKPIRKPIFKEEYSVSEFYKKLNVQRSTYNLWKEKGFFKNEKIISDRKRTIPLSDINEFLEAHTKYKKIWNS